MAEWPESPFRVVLVLRVVVGLRGVLGNLVESPIGVAQRFLGFRFLKSVEEFDGVDKFFFQNFMLILLPLLLHFCVESVPPAFAGYRLF